MDRAGPLLITVKFFLLFSSKVGSPPAAPEAAQTQDKEEGKGGVGDIGIIRGDTSTGIAAPGWDPLGGPLDGRSVTGMGDRGGVTKATRGEAGSEVREPSNQRRVSLARM